MGASLSTTVIDQALNYFLNNVDRVLYCSGEPTSHSDAEAKKLAEDAVTAADFSGPTAGDTSGRKITYDKRGFLADASGSHDHVAYLDDDNTHLLAVNQADDGTGSAVSFTKDLAYNIQDTDTVEIRAAQTT